MKRLSQIVCLILVCSMMMVVPVLAAGVPSRASDYFGSHSVYLTKPSSTQFQVNFSVTAVDEMDKLGANVITIQRSSDGSNWTDIATFTKEGYPSLVRSNAGMHSGTLNYAYNSNYKYRAYIEFYAKKGNGTAYYSDYSASI